MPDYIASVDAGNGGVNAFMVDTTGKLHSFYETSVRAPVTGQSLGLKEGELSYSWVEWGGNRYATGDEAVEIAQRGLERHLGINRYGNEFHQFLVAVALAKMGIKSGEVDLTLFAPPGLYRDAKDFIIKNFSRKRGQVALMLNGDKEPRTFRYSNVSVLPEGIGAAACFILDEHGQTVKTDALSGNVLLVDIGAYTLDTVLLQSGQFNPETLVHASWEKSGVHHFVREPVLMALRGLSPEFSLVTVDHIDQVIRSGNYNLGGADLKGAITKNAERYAEWIANTVIDGAYDGLRGINSVILVGGGVYLVQKHLKKWYGGKLLDPKEYPQVKDISPLDMNAMGGLRRSIRRLQPA